MFVVKKIMHTFHYNDIKTKTVEENYQLLGAFKQICYNEEKNIFHRSWPCTSSAPFVALQHLYLFIKLISDSGRLTFKNPEHKTPQNSHPIPPWQQQPHQITWSSPFPFWSPQDCWQNHIFSLLRKHQDTGQLYLQGNDVPEKKGHPQETSTHLL